MIGARNQQTQSFAYSLLSILAVFVFAATSTAGTIFINEIRANDASTDDIEFVELIGLAGTDIGGFSLVHVNGSTSNVEIFNFAFPAATTVPDDGITDVDGNAAGFVVLAQESTTTPGTSDVPNTDFLLPASVQNGEDGLILFDDGGNVLDAVAWQGPGDLLTERPELTDTLPTSQPNFLTVTVDDDSTDDGLSLGSNSLFDAADINWSVDVATPGMLNAGQTSGSLIFEPSTCSPGDTDNDGDIDTGDLTTSIQNFTGAGGSTTKTCAEGDTDEDGDVDTGDLTFSIQNFTGAQAGNAGVPDLVYDPATGNVTIDADGADVISFSLQSGPFNAADFSELPAGLTDNIASQIGWTSFNLFSGLTGTANLGAILPAGLDQAGLEAALQTASYGLALAGGGGGGRLDLIIPEPASMVLMGLGAVAFVRRRRAA